MKLPPSLYIFLYIIVKYSFNKSYLETGTLISFFSNKSSPVEIHSTGTLILIAGGVKLRRPSVVVYGEVSS